MILSSMHQGARIMFLKNLIIACTGVALGVAPLAAAPPAVKPVLNVVTSTTDLRDIAQEVGGTRVSVVNISEGYQDPHFVEAKPSFILKLRDADVFAFVGLDLEIGWMPLLVQGARNAKIRQGGSGYLDVSSAIPVIDVPRGKVDRSQGDVHPLGNPHYWLDPQNGRRIARLFQQRFTQLDPAGAAVYAQNAKNFAAKVDAAERSWTDERAKMKGKPIIAWHTSWRYFAEYAGVEIVGFMEPKPGVPPSASHLASLILTMKRTGAKVIVMEPFYDRKMADFVAARTGAKVLILPSSVGGVKGIDDYVQLLDYDIKRVAAEVS
jgi:ABC-type Zn uptake system ZnuABC Zn-binding protein ZnuA